MAIDRDPKPFIEEEFSMPEYEEIHRELVTRPEISRLKEIVSIYEKKIADPETTSQKKIEYEKILKSVKKSLTRKDPEIIIRVDQKYLKDRFEKLNV